MSFQPANRRLSRHSLPDQGDGFFGWFWASPQATGFYGQPSKWLIVSSNNKGEIFEWGMILKNLNGGGLYAVDTGGLRSSVSLALRSIGGSSTTQLYEVLKDGTSDSIIFVPASLAGQLGVGNSTNINGWIPHIIPDAPSAGKMVIEKIIKPEGNEAVDTSRTGQYRTKRFTLPLQAMGLWIGQALLFMIPLMIFGIPILLTGELLLFVSAIILAITWQIIPIPGWLKGILIGGILTAIVLWYGNAESLVPLTKLYLALAAFLSSFWMSIVFSGAKR